MAWVRPCHREAQDRPAGVVLCRADLAGVYYDLGSITKEQSDDLRSNGFPVTKAKANQHGLTFMARPVHGLTTVVSFTITRPLWHGATRRTTAGSSQCSPMAMPSKSLLGSATSPTPSRTLSSLTAVSSCSPRTLDSSEPAHLTLGLVSAPQ